MWINSCFCLQILWAYKCASVDPFFLSPINFRSVAFPTSPAGTHPHIWCFPIQLPSNPCRQGILSMEEEDTRGGCTGCILVAFEASTRQCPLLFWSLQILCCEWLGRQGWSERWRLDFPAGAAQRSLWHQEEGSVWETKWEQMAGGFDWPHAFLES